jgi:hypothetical protein
LDELTVSAWTKINKARARARAFIWGQLDRLAASKVAGTSLDPEMIV